MGLTRWDTPCYSTVMPNKRADDKKQFTAAFRKEELARIDAFAQKLGITRTEFLRKAAEEALRNWNDNNKVSK